MFDGENMSSRRNNKQCLTIEGRLLQAKSFKLFVIQRDDSPV